MNVRKNLAQLLDVPCKVFASDWTSLGAEVGLTFVEKMSLEGKLHRHESNTLALFEEWSKNPKNTVGRILDALEKIRRPHEVGMLIDAKNEILECYASIHATETNSIQLSDKIPYPCDVSVDGTVSEISSISDSYYLNSYERFVHPSCVMSEEQNSRQLSYSIPDTSSIADSRLGQHEIHLAHNNLALVDKNYNRSHCTIPEKINNCDRKSMRVFVTYGNGNEKHSSCVFHLVRFLDQYFYCNVDLKNKRLSKSKVDEYFNQAHFVILCFDKEYMKSIQQFKSNKEEQPEELHTAYIFSKIKEECLQNGLTHRFVPLLLKGGSADNIPLFLKNKSYKWPEQYNDIKLFLSDP